MGGALAVVAVVLAVALIGVVAWALHERRRGRLAEREVAAESRRGEAMRRSLEHLMEGVALVDASGVVALANPAAQALLGLEEGRPVAVGFLARLLDEAEDGATLRRTVEVEQSDGAHALLVTVAPAGAGARLVVVEDLRSDSALERRRRDFVANASHELKTPLAALIGLLDLAREVEDERRDDLLARAQRNALALARMAEDLLALARAEDPDWLLDPAPLRLEALAEEALEDFRGAAAERGIALDLVRAEGASPVVVGDAEALRTILRNLLANAVAHTREGGVTVVVAAEPFGASIEVRDTGEGIDPEVLPHIFERFYRGDAAHGRDAGRTGLGLSIVRNLLARLGGRISVRSAPGRGTVFRVELPEEPHRPLAGAGQPEFR